MSYKFPHPELPNPDSEKSIFINCPYDSEYEPFFDAIIFSVVASGFIPRSAKESEMIAVSRMERILHALYTSKYSIHDLSRCRYEGNQMLARFNMPLELGLAMSRRYPGNGKILHNWLVLVPNDAPYGKFVSDLSGFDLKQYPGNETELIRALLAWLMVLPGALPRICPSPVIERFLEFKVRKKQLKEEWGDDVPWKSLLEAVKATIPDFA